MPTTYNVIASMREALTELIGAARRWSAARYERRKRQDLKGDLQIAEQHATQDLEETLHLAEAHILQQHTDDIRVDAMADAMKVRLAEKRAEGRGGWDDAKQCTVEYLAALLVGAVVKGKSVDVANFAMMLHERGAAPSALTQALLDHFHASQLPLLNPGWTPEGGEGWSDNDEDFRHESIEELLDSNDQLKPGDCVYVGDTVRPDPATYLDADDVINQVADRGYDDGGEYADGYPDSVSEEAKAQLNRFLSAWLRTHCAPRFYQVKNSRPYTLTAADFPASTDKEATHG